MIMGPSGTGKSVCISHMVGLMRPDSGDVRVEGVSVAQIDSERLLRLRKEKFGVLFQDGALFSSMNVFDNVAFPLRQNTDKDEAEIEAIVSGGWPRLASPTRRAFSPTSCLVACASVSASLVPWHWIRTWCCSTSRTRALIRCAPPCCAT